MTSPLNLVPYVGSNNNIENHLNYDEQQTEEQQTTDFRTTDTAKTILNEQNSNNPKVFQSEVTDSIVLPTDLSFPPEIMARIFYHAGFRVGTKGKFSKDIDPYLKYFYIPLTIEKINQERLGLGKINPSLLTVLKYLTPEIQNVEKDELIKERLYIIDKQKELIDEINHCNKLHKLQKEILNRVNLDLNKGSGNLINQLLAHQETLLKRNMEHVSKYNTSLNDVLEKLKLDFEVTLDNFKPVANQISHFSLTGIKSIYPDEIALIPAEQKQLFFTNFLNTFKNLESIDLFYSENNFDYALSSNLSLYPPGDIYTHDIKDYDLYFLSILLQNNPNIKELAIGEADASQQEHDNSEKIIDLLRNLNNIKVLKIKNEFRTFPQSAMKLPSLKNLEILFIGKNGGVFQEDLEIISEHITGLKKMYLDMSEDRCELHELLSSISKFPKLKELIIDMGKEIIVPGELDKLFQSYTPPPSLKKLQLITWHAAEGTKTGEEIKKLGSTTIITNHGNDGGENTAQKHQELHDICSKFLPGTEITISPTHSPWIFAK